MHNNSGAAQLITILAVNVGAYSLTGINAAMGAISLVLSISYTAVKLYNEIKITKQLKDKK
jgi:hypothetical protein